MEPYVLTSILRIKQVMCVIIRSDFVCREIKSRHRINGDNLALQTDEKENCFYKMKVSVYLGPGKVPAPR